MSRLPLRSARSPGPGTVLLLAVLVVLAGCAGVPSQTETNAPAGSLEAKWLSDTKRDIVGNHHAAYGAVVNGTPIVVAPISGHKHGGHAHDDGDEHAHASGCALIGLNGTTGEVRWRESVPPANCTIHSVADPTIADLVGDDAPEALVASTTETVSGYEPLTGEQVFEHAITEYGYTRPLVAEFDGSAEPEMAVADIRGNVVVVQPNGTELWHRSLDGDVQAQPHAVDLDGDAAFELVVGLTTGEVVALDDDGTTLWRVRAGESSVIWQTAGQADDDPAVETVVATFGGRVAMVDDDGAVVWGRDVGEIAAVHAFGDGDGDGVAEVYAVDRNGTLRAMTATDGETEWISDLTPGEAQTTPPPVMGDLDGDGDPELAVALNSGRVVVVDPTDGDVLAAYSRDVPIWTHPTLADLDGDAGAEVVVTYGDGRVALLEYEPPDSE